LSKGAIVVEETSQNKILVVDDEAGMREGCRRALSPAGYVVEAAADLASARDLIRKKAYDTYLLDVMLPDGSGLDLLREILEKDPSAVCIIITGFGSIEMAVEAVRQGAYNFLSKPFTSDELLMAVQQGLERHRLKAIEQAAEELTQAKQELERLDEVKSQLMLKVAHELRAPVAAVQSYINLIVAGYVSQNEMKPTLKRVQERLQEMLDLIADLLELARLKQARDLVAEAGPQDMAQILKEVCDLFREQAQEKRQSLQLDIMDHPVLAANRDHLKQIWTNLISNAIKYTPEGGRVAVTLQAGNDKVVGVVEDNGMGIAPEDMSNLFQEFFRTDEAKASGAIGTGLGLSIVKQIVDAYGGEIKVTSRPGQGTRFTFVLPTEPPAPKPRSQPEEKKTPPTAPLPNARTHTRSIILGEETTPGSQP
jgi:two-component system sensor histidine kinase/response regulator